MRCPTDGFALDHTALDPLVGTTVAGKYEVEALVGEGASGRVYRARHAQLKQKQFALKILFGDLAANATMRLRFAHEATSASCLSHPNVVPVFDCGETTEGIVYLAMEYVDGSPLSRWIAHGPIELAITPL